MFSDPILKPLALERSCVSSCFSSHVYHHFSSCATEHDVGSRLLNLTTLTTSVGDVIPSIIVRQIKISYETKKSLCVGECLQYILKSVFCGDI